MKTKTIIGAVVATVFVSLSASAQQDDQAQGRQGPPSVDEIFEKMDENEDGKLSKEEVKGPLLKMFAKIDSDEDGFLSKEEVENAPRPERPKRN